MRHGNDVIAIVVSLLVLGRRLNTLSHRERGLDLGVLRIPSLLLSVVERRLLADRRGGGEAREDVPAAEGGRGLHASAFVSEGEGGGRALVGGITLARAKRELGECEEGSQSMLKVC